MSKETTIDLIYDKCDTTDRILNIDDSDKFTATGEVYELKTETGVLLMDDFDRLNVTRLFEDECVPESKSPRHCLRKTKQSIQGGIRSVMKCLEERDTIIFIMA